jgi:sterol desaturase/sphingolipid hydroxylase (fatty acid hydroxylase superfamily)
MQAPAQNKTGKKLQGTLFQNPVLNNLTKSSPQLILSMYIPLILFMLGYDYLRNGQPLSVVLGLFGAGVFTWTLAEYFLHKYFFHFVNETPWVQRMHFLVHGYHHEYPRDKEHLFMPPIPSLVLAGSFFGLFYLILRGYAVSFFPGFVAGYLAYALMHYSMHTVTNPPKFLRPLWRHHQMHHHKHSNKAFGVSSPLWDYVFGTVPREDANAAQAK